MKIQFNIFKNNRKTADNQPDYQGTGKDDEGNEYEISSWIKKDKNGNSYLSSVLKNKFVPENKTQEPKAQQSKQEPCDDLPF